MEYSYNKKVYIFLTLCLIVIASLFLYSSQDTVTGRAIQVIDPAYGQLLKGKFLISPANVVGGFPSGSDIKVTVASDDGTFSKTWNVYALASSDYVNNYVEEGEFYPTLEVTIGFTGSGSSTLNQPDQVFQIRKNVNSPMEIVAPLGYTPSVKLVRLRGQTIPNYQVTLSGNAQEGYILIANYFEYTNVFKHDAPMFSLSLNPFGLTVPSEGTVTVELFWQDEKIYSESLDIYAEEPIENSQQPVVPFTPEQPIEENLDSFCQSYTCEMLDTSSTCDIPSFAEIAQGVPLAAGFKKWRCQYNDLDEQGNVICDKVFWLSMACDQSVPVKVDIVNLQPESEDSKGIVVKYGTKDFSSRARVTSLINPEVGIPVAHLIVDSDNVLQSPSYLDVVFVQSDRENYPHCSNNVLDQGESGVDCGGDCKACLLETRSYFGFIIWILAGSSFIVAFLAYRNYSISRV